jgi:WD40 repeat protein
MSEVWARPVARIRRGNAVVGAGMLAPGGAVLTCAHVIADALSGTGATVGPGVKVKLDFPFPGILGIDATVANNGWYPEIPEIDRGPGSPPSDLAVLELPQSGPLAMLEACLVPESDTPPGTKFSAWGFPVGYPTGAMAQGTLRGADPGGRLDAVADDAFGHFVEPGFSGAPVFAGQEAQVIPGNALGICVTNDAGGKRIARIISPAHLAQALRAVISPYRWLAAFEARDTPFFFGREALADSLWQDLRQRRFLLLAGASGSGKSSVLRAGLATRAASAGYAVRIFRPLGDARAELAAALGLPRKAEIAAVADAIGREAKKQPLMLGMDQAEELVRGTESERAGAMLQAFAELREELDDRFLVALAARSDALDALFVVQPRLGSRAAPGLLERHLRFLDLLGREELHAAIVRPAARLRARFAPGLADNIVEDVLRDQVPLPVVQLCLSRLWQSRVDGEIPASAYAKMGGVTGALVRQASDVLEEIKRKARALADQKINILFFDTQELSERLVAQARAILVHLVQVGASHAEDRRRRVAVSELPRLRVGLFDFITGTVAEFLARQELEAGRLVVTVRLPDGAEALELAHDSLLTEWKELRYWVDEDRSFRRWQDRLTARVQDSPEDLLSGAALLEAERILQQEAEQAAIGVVRLDPRVRDFIASSHAAEQMRAQTEAARLRAERDAALRMGSLFLAERARQATTQGDAMTGMLLALDALPDRALEDQRPVVSEAIFALHEAWARNRERLCLVSNRPVYHAVFSPDGTRILTASDDCTARVWDAATGTCLAICKGHTDRVHHAVFSPDGTRILTASDDCTARVWDAATGTCLATCEGHTGSVPHAAFSPDGTRILTASGDRIARVWDAATGARLATCKGHMGSLYHATFSPDGTRILTASDDCTARVWDAATGTCRATCEGHTSSVYHAAFGPDGTRILTASGDRIARVWDAATGACLTTCQGHTSSVYRASFSPDGSRIATASGDRSARVWDAATGTSLATCEGHTGSVYHAAFSPNGTRILTASADRIARVWDAATGACLATCEGHTDRVHHAAFSPDGTRILTASGDRTARVWGAPTGACLATCEGHTDRVHHAAFSPDGTRILTASGDRTARMWDAATGACLATCEGHKDWVGNAAFSPDGTRILTASGDRTARVWDAATGACLAICEGHTSWMHHAAFGPDGTRILTASGDCTARVWDAATGACLATCDGHTDRVHHAEFSPGGTRIATASGDHAARVWDAATGTCLATCDGHTGSVYHSAFSPDGTRILTASGDRTARMWDAVTGTCLATCEGHTGSLHQTAFSPDGTRILTTSDDCTARVWDAASGTCLTTYEGHTSSLHHAAFSPDGTRILTASGDRTARVWRCFRNAAELVAFVSPLLTRGLTARQRRDNHLPPVPDAPADLDAIPPPNTVALLSKSLRFFTDGAAKKWPLRGSLKLG